MRIESVSTNVSTREQGSTGVEVKQVQQPVKRGNQSEKVMGGKKPLLEEQVAASDEILDRSVEQANKALEGYNRKIDRVVHDVTKTVMYTLKDTKTDEVIREFPPKKIQDMIAKMWELAGLFVDEKA